MGSSYSDYILFYKLFEIYRNEFKFDDEMELDEHYFNKNSFQTIESKVRKKVFSNFQKISTFRRFATSFR